MDPITIVSTVASVVKTCYSLYGNEKLRPANRKRAKYLGDKLRHLEEMLSDEQIKTHPKLHQSILAQIETDVRHIKEFVEDTLEKACKRFGFSAFFDAPAFAKELQDAVGVAMSCCGRVEAVQMAVEEVRRESSYTHQMELISRQVQTVVDRVNVDRDISAVIHLHITAAANMLPSTTAPVSASAAPVPSGVDESERLNVETLAQIPPAMERLVLSGARDRLRRAEFKQIIDGLIEQWDGWHIREEDISFDHRGRGRRPITLGMGGFGRVFAGTLSVKSTCPDGRENLSVAIKQISLSGDERMLSAEVIREVLLQMTLHHECILPCYGVNLPPWAGTSDEISRIRETAREEAPEALIITPRMSCSLAEALLCLDPKKSLASFADKVRATTDVASALVFLHKKNVVHRDVKPENILLDFDETGMVGCAKLSDFGSSRRAYNEKSMRLMTTAGRATGTPLFMPPEALVAMESCATTSSWDIWSFGVLLCYVFAFEQRPIISFSEVERMAHAGSWMRRVNDWASHIGDDLIRTMAEGCLVEQPERRCTAQDLFYGSSSCSEVPSDGQTESLQQAEIPLIVSSKRLSLAEGQGGESSDVGESQKSYKVFLGYAGPEKSSVAEPIYQALVRHGIKCFFYFAELNISAESADAQTVRALNEARVGIFILSPEFATRGWPMYELQTFLSRVKTEQEQSPTIIPVFFRLDPDECSSFYQGAPIPGGDMRWYGRHQDVLESSFMINEHIEKYGSLHRLEQSLSEVSHFQGVTSYLQGQNGKLPTACIAQRTIDMVLAESVSVGLTQGQEHTGEASDTFFTTTGASFDDSKPYDVFLSYTQPDRVPIVEPIYRALCSHGLKPFFYNATHAGNVQEQSMRALKEARMGIFILSPEFGARESPMKELHAFLTRFRESVDSKPVLLPVYFRLQIDDSRTFFKSTSTSNETQWLSHSRSILENSLYVQHVLHTYGGCDRLSEDFVELGRFPGVHCSDINKDFKDDGDTSAIIVQTVIGLVLDQFKLQ